MTDANEPSEAQVDAAMDAWYEARDNLAEMNVAMHAALRAAGVVAEEPSDAYYVPEELRAALRTAGGA